MASEQVCTLMPRQSLHNADAVNLPALLHRVRQATGTLHTCLRDSGADRYCVGIAPELAPSGSGGSYFLYDRDRNVVAVFKPTDEEPNMRNNPRGHAPSPLSRSLSPGSTPPKELYVRRGILPGQGAYREIAAYLLGGYWAGVPATAPVRLTYPDGSAKHGSLQQFVESDCDCEEMGYSTCQSCCLMAAACRHTASFVPSCEATCVCGTSKQNTFVLLCTVSIV